MKKSKLALGIVISSIFLLGACDYAEMQVLGAMDAYRVGDNIDVDSRMVARGVVESERSRSIYSALGFEIERVYVEIGDVVTAGQRLAVLDSRDLLLAIQSEEVALKIARQRTQVAAQDARRVLDNATANLANNASLQIVNAENALNVAEANLAAAQRSYHVATENKREGNVLQVLNAEAALSAARTSLAMAQRDYDNAARDYAERDNFHVLSTEHNLATSRADLQAIETTYNNRRILYEAQVIATAEMQQTETALIQARSRYADALATNRDATSTEGRHLEDLRELLGAATTAYQDALAMLNAAEVAAAQDIERLRQDISRFTADVENARRLVEANRTAASQDIERLRTNSANADIATNLEQMELSLTNLRRQLEDTTITAPVSGTLTYIAANEGAAALGRMFTIEDTDNLKVTTSFREYDIAKIYEGMEVIITSDSTGVIEHTGAISRISPTALSYSSIVEFEVEIEITSAEAGLRSGMNVRVEVVVAQGD